MRLTCAQIWYLAKVSSLGYLLNNMARLSTVAYIGFLTSEKEYAEYDKKEFYCFGDYVMNTFLLFL